MPLLFDTGPLYALADADDAWHARVRDFVESSNKVPLVPVTVLPEVTYLLHERLGAPVEQRFVDSLIAGELAVEPLRRADLERTAELLRLAPELGFVDCSVVAVAERLRLDSIVTTDRRHFSAVRPSHRDAFELLP